MKRELHTIYLAGGCFWGLEKYLALIPGVAQTQVGYANGRTLTPSYEDVCHHNTGHAETVLVHYDPQVISLTGLLELYFNAIDPTSLYRQGMDIGKQYRSGIYYTDAADKSIITKALAELQKKFEMPVVIEVAPLDNYYPAEEYHQKYMNKNPGGCSG